MLTVIEVTLYDRLRGAPVGAVETRKNSCLRIEVAERARR